VLGVPKLRRKRWLSLGSDVVIPVALSEFGPRLEVIYGPSRQWELSWRLIRRGDTVVDVGANIGMWGLRAARQAGPQGSVHCFEPNGHNADRLSAHATLNSLTNLQVHRIALADRCGSATFYAPVPEDSGAGSLAPNEGLRGGAEVELATLDSITTEMELGRINLLKVDVEGAEELVFRGAHQTLAGDSAPIVLFESAPDMARLMGSSCEAVGGLLEAHGYRIYRYRESRMMAVTVGDDHDFDDLFAVKPAHMEERPVLLELIDAPEASLPPFREGAA
jgi:FkbM family methyltransferase